MANLELYDNLRKARLPGKKDLKDLLAVLADNSTLEIILGIPITASKKATVVIHLERYCTTVVSNDHRL